jgi:hypothetical protein
MTVAKSIRLQKFKRNLEYRLFLNPQGSQEGVKAQLAADIAAQAAFDRVQTTTRSHQPVPIDLLAEGFDFLSKVGVAKNTARWALRGLQQVRKQTIEQGQDIFKRFTFLLGELGGGREDLSVFLAGDGLFQQPQDAPAEARRFFQIDR